MKERVSGGGGGGVGGGGEGGGGGGGGVDEGLYEHSVIYIYRPLNNNM